MNLIITYAADHVSIFRDDSGMSTQVALIYYPRPSPPTPAEMISLTNELAKNFNWQEPVTNGKTETVPVAPVPMKKPAKKQHSGKPNPTDPSVAERKAGILRVLKDGPADRRSIILRLGLVPNAARITRWHHQFTDLMRTGQIVSDNGNPALYSLPPVVDATEEPIPGDATDAILDLIGRDE